MSAPQIGKSFALIACWLLGSTWLDAGRCSSPSWVVAPTFGAAKDRYMRYVVEPARSAGILDSHTESVPFVARLINGQVIEARSWENPDGLWGSTVARIALDEFGLLSREGWTVLRTRTSETALQGRGYIRGAGNVTEIGGIAEELYRLAESGAEGQAARTWTWRQRALAASCECGDIPIEIAFAERHESGCERGMYLRELATAQGEMSEAHFRQLYEAEWLDWSALPVYTFDRALNVDAEKATYQPDLPVDLSCDFNVDPMCWILGQHKGQYAWAFDEIVIPGGATTGDACAEFIRRHPDTKRTPVEVYGDPAGNSRSPKSRLTDYDIIRQEIGGKYPRFSMHVPTGHYPVPARVNAYNARLRSATGEVRYFVHPDCKVLINDLLRVGWKPGTREIDKSDKKLTHASEADGNRIVKLYPVHEQAAAAVGLASIYTPHVLEPTPDMMSERF